MFHGNGHCVWPGSIPLSCIIKPKSVDKVLMEATVRNVRVDGTKVKVYRRIDICSKGLMRSDYISFT